MSVQYARNDAQLTKCLGRSPGGPGLLDAVYSEDGNESVTNVLQGLFALTLN